MALLFLFFLNQFRLQFHYRAAGPVGVDMSMRDNFVSTTKVTERMKQQLVNR